MQTAENWFFVYTMCIIIHKCLYRVRAKSNEQKFQVIEDVTVALTLSNSLFILALKNEGKKKYGVHFLLPQLMLILF